MSPEIESGPGGACGAYDGRRPWPRPYWLGFGAVGDHRRVFAAGCGSWTEQGASA